MSWDHVTRKNLVLEMFMEAFYMFIGDKEELFFEITCLPQRRPEIPFGGFENG